MQIRYSEPLYTEFSAIPERKHGLKLLINLLTNYGEQNSWENDSRSASQETLRLLWNSKIHYCVWNSPKLYHIL